MVHVSDPRVRWSVPASRVVRIVPAAAWRAPLVDVIAALGAAPVTDIQTRVMIVCGAGDRELAVLAAGAIDIAEVDPADVLALPEAFAVTTPHISAIVVASDHSLSLLLQPAAVRHPDGTVLGEEPCPSRS